MKVIHLPILPATSPLKDAVKAMRIQQRSALIRETPTKLDLIRVPKIFNALGHHLTELSNVNINEPVYRLSSTDISTWHLNIKNPDKAQKEWQQFLDSVKQKYALADSFLGTGLLVSRREPDLDGTEFSPEDCYCLGPAEHSFPPPKITSGNPCPFCKKAVHCE